MVIDFHTHTFPAELASKALEKLSNASGTAAYTDGTAVGLVSSMHRSGIELSVVLPVATNPKSCAHINDVSFQSQTSGLVFFGAMHPEAPDWHAELDRLAARGVPGIKLHPVYQGIDFDDLRCLRILDRAGELGLIVVTHAGDDIGFPGEQRCTPEMLDNALQQVGPVSLVAAHFGGWNNWERVEPLSRYPNLMLDTAFSLGEIPTRMDGRFHGRSLQMLTQDQAMRLIRTFGAERILFGTDSPWTEQSREIEKLNALPLTQKEREAIMGGNTERFLRRKRS